MHITFTLKKDFYTPTAPDTVRPARCFIKAGDLAAITGVHGLDENPLYTIRTAGGDSGAILKSLLIEHGFEFYSDPPEETKRSLKF